MPGPHLSNPNSTELGSVGKLTKGQAGIFLNRFIKQDPAHPIFFSIIEKYKSLPSHKTPARSGLPFLQVPEVFDLQFLLALQNHPQHSQLLLQATHLAVSGQSVFERLWYRGTTNQDRVCQMSGSEFLSGKQIKEVTFNCIQCHII